MKLIGDSMFGYPIKQLAREYGRFLVVGVFNVLVCFLLYELFVLIDPLPAYTLGVAFLISESISSVISHYLHRRVTFQSSSPYGRSLKRTLVIYAVSIGIASIIHHFVADVWVSDNLNPQMVEYVSWYLNTALVGMIAFLALRFIAFPPSDDEEE
jgi:putative flippase GtrA